MSEMTEDQLVQQTTANYLRDQLGWEVEYAFQETYGPEGTLGRNSDRDIVLTRYLGEKLMALNPGLPMEAYEKAIKQITETSVSETLLTTNRSKYELLRNGVKVGFRNERGNQVTQSLRVFDFEEPANNHFLAVRELWVRRDPYLRRADLVGFVNGIPLLFMELKNVHKNVRAAFDANFADYKDTVPHLFHHNAFVILANGINAKVGSVSSRYEHFAEWKRLAENEPGRVDMETLLKGICDKQNFMDLFENFIVFDDSSGKMIKILARNHQFLGVNKALQSVINREKNEGKLGVFWHTQGSGKSFSMVFFTQKVLRKIGNNFTFLVLTDRDDLDSQIYNTFAGCGLANNDRNPCRPATGKKLKAMLAEDKSFIFSLIQKFNQDVSRGKPYSSRKDIIIITDEAHRTQSGLLSLNLRNALPNASFIGFTGTPLFSDDEITRRMFGDYVSRYDFQHAVSDQATLPLYYDSRGEKLQLDTTQFNQKIADKLEELEEEGGVDVVQRLEQDLKNAYHIMTAEQRLDRIARDFVDHYATAWESGKAMFVSIDKITCFRMQGFIDKHWKARIARLEKEALKATDEADLIFRQRQINWMRDTEIAVVVSEEQGEVAKFNQHGIDIEAYRNRMKQGFANSKGKSTTPELAFKDPESRFRVVIVCAMWLTGFDVPSLSTLYLDKPLKAHTLMQAIARANRVFEGKTNGLVVDYCGILKNLREALASYAGNTEGEGEGGNGEGENPIRTDEEMLEILASAVKQAQDFLSENGFMLENITNNQGFDRIQAIASAKEVINVNSTSRKKFELLARDAFNWFKACLNIKGINTWRLPVDAIKILYKSLQDDKEKADLTEIAKELHAIIDGAISIKPPESGGKVEESQQIFDISKIDFARLKKEFERSDKKNTTVQKLQDVAEKKLNQLVVLNPKRTDFQKHYEKILARYNKEKDRATIEKSFDELIAFIEKLGEESARAMQEGLDEETLALFDLLKKPELDQKEQQKIKKVAVALLNKLKQDIQGIEDWTEKENTQDKIKTAINNFLYSDDTGLPHTSYEENDVSEKSEQVYIHVRRAYHKLPSPVYGITSPQPPVQLQLY